MSLILSRFRNLYGAGPAHLLLVLSSAALAAYAISLLGVSTLWDPAVWWQSILVWFVGAVVAHDLLLFPAYALADRLLQRGPGRRNRGTRASRPSVSSLNYVRVPLLAVGLLFLLFFPGIIAQGADSYQRATGQTQEPFLQRWLLLSAGIFAISALAHVGMLLLASRKPEPTAPSSDSVS